MIETRDAESDAEARTALEAAMTKDIVAALDGLHRARLEEGAALSGLIGGFLSRIEGLTRGKLKARQAGNLPPFETGFSAA